jgi:hypothetical protein
VSGLAAPWAKRLNFCLAQGVAGLGVAEPPQAKRGGRPPAMGWFGHPSIFFWIFSFFFFLFFFLKKNVMGAFWE